MKDATVSTSHYPGIGIVNRVQYSYSPNYNTFIRWFRKTRRYKQI